MSAGFRIRRAALLASVLAIALAVPAIADEHDRGHEREWHEHRFDEHHHHDFHGRDFSHFDEFEIALWQGGRWHHDWYGGRYGWWWEVDGVWYFYPEPIYPYPTYVPTVAVVEPPPSYPPPPAPVVVQAPPPAPPPPAGPPPAQSWYYCDDTRSYYPYVATCPSPWRQVPAVRPAQ